MASGCKSSISCIDSRMPARAAYVSLHRWPESDAEFVKTVIAGETNLKRWGAGPGPGPPVVDSFSCRQMYLRSYTFSKKESKMQKCIGKVKERAADFPFIGHQRRESGGASVDGGSVKSERRKKKQKKGCAGVKKLREGSYTVVRSMLRRLLSCSSSVDVIDGSSQP